MPEKMTDKQIVNRLLDIKLAYLRMLDEITDLMVELEREDQEDQSKSRA